MTKKKFFLYKMTHIRSVVISLTTHKMFLIISNVKKKN